MGRKAPLLRRIFRCGSAGTTAAGRGTRSLDDSIIYVILCYTTPREGGKRPFCCGPRPSTRQRRPGIHPSGDRGPGPPTLPFGSTWLRPNAFQSRRRPPDRDRESFITSPPGQRRRRISAAACPPETSHRARMNQFPASAGGFGQLDQLRRMRATMKRSVVAFRPPDPQRVERRPGRRVRTLRCPLRTEHGRRRSPDTTPAAAGARRRRTASDSPGTPPPPSPDAPGHDAGSLPRPTPAS